MKIIDTHAHIYSVDFKNDTEEVIQRAKKIGVEKILLPNISIFSIEGIYKLVEDYPNYCYPMMGLHPNYVKENWKEDLTKIKEEFSTHSFIAVGEIGIDLFRNKAYQKEQTDAFIEQMHWAIEYDLPIVIHARDANKEVIEAVKSVKSEKLRGVFHSFAGTLEEMNEILALDNFLLGINGIATFQNSNLHKLLKHTDISKIIVETDAPYLAPIPHRGKRNEPAYTLHVVEELANIFEMEASEIAEKTTLNAKNLFSLS